MTHFYWYGVEIFGFLNDGSDFWQTLAMIITLTIALYTFIKVLILRQRDKKLIIFCYLNYCLLMIYVLFFKSIGISGYNFDLVKYINDGVSFDLLGLVFNLVMFIPLGFLFSPKVRNIGIFLGLILCIELIQGVLSLGIFDLGDLLFNTLGFFIGSVLHYCLNKASF